MKTVHYDNGYAVFYSNGKKKYEMFTIDRDKKNNYKSSEIVYLTVFYHKNGQKKIEYKSDYCGRKQEQETQWNEYGYLNWVLNWKDNKLDGPSIRYDWSGNNITKIQTWRDGVQSGVTQTFYHGWIVSESTYVDGQRTERIPVGSLIEDWEKEQIENKEEKKVA
jgi:antitoxin component YwqK of YwqJK toxin-antitoxin module